MSFPRLTAEEWATTPVANSLSKGSAQPSFRSSEGTECSTKRSQLLVTILPWKVQPLSADLHRHDKILQMPRACCPHAPTKNFSVDTHHFVEGVYTPVLVVVREGLWGSLAALHTGTPSMLCILNCCRCSSTQAEHSQKLTRRRKSQSTMSATVYLPEGSKPNQNIGTQFKAQQDHKF